MALDVSAKLIIYQAFIEGEIDLSKHLAAPAHNRPFGMARIVGIAEYS